MSQSFAEISKELAAADPAVQQSKMFGMPTLKINGKAFAGLFGEDMVFKLAGDAHLQALSVGGAHLFEPMIGRAMKEWVVVPASHQQTWPDFARAAKNYVKEKAA